METYEELLLLIEGTLHSDPYNCEFLQKLSNLCGEKAERTATDWQLLSHYELLKRSDYELWHAAENRQNRNGTNQNYTSRNVWSTASKSMPTAYNIMRSLTEAQLSLDTIIAGYNKCSMDFIGSQPIFKMITDELIAKENCTLARQMYEKRLQVPHMQLQETFDSYSQFVSKYFSDQYNVIMRAQSRVKSDTEKYQKYYEAFEFKLQLNAADDAGLWMQYMENVFQYAPNEELKKGYASIFYRSLEFVNKHKSWNGVFETALSCARNDTSTTELKKLISTNWLKAFPYSFKALEGLALVSETEFELASISDCIQGHVDNTTECLNAVKAVLSAQYVKCSDTPQVLLGIRHALGTYTDTFPNSFDVMLLAVTVASKFSDCRPGDLVLKYFGNNQHKAAFYNYALRYFSISEEDEGSFDMILRHFETDAEKFDDPFEVLPYIENYYLLVSETSSYQEYIDKMENLRRRISSQKSTKRLLSDTEVEKNTEISVEVDECSGPEVKRIKENVPLKEVQHRNREQFSIMVTGFDSTVTESQIRHFFDGYGNPVSVTISQYPRLSATVELLSEQEVLTCLTRTEKSLAGQTVQVERVFGSTLWLTNYPPRYGTQQIETLILDKTGSKPLSIRLPTQVTSRERRFCYVDFANPEITAKVKKELDGMEIEHFVLRAEISNPALKRDRGITSPKHQIYIRNLDFVRTSKETLQNAFSAFGSIDSISMPLKAQHQGSLNSGYAFITFRDEKSVTSATNTKFIEIDGRTVEIYPLKPREAHERDARSFDEQKLVTIQNLSSSVTAKQLSGYLETVVGPVKRANLNSSRGTALVEFESVSDAGKAGILIPGLKFEDRTLLVTDKSGFFETETTTKVPMMVSPMMMRRRGKR